jgi:DNA-binding NarL/FixJ family response regulator
MPTEIRLIIADDHPVFRKGLRLMIAADPELQVLDDAGDGAQALHLIRTLQPDVAVLDVNMPGQSGFDVAREIQPLALPTRLVFLTMHRDEEMFKNAFDLGAQGYLLKESAVEEIVACIKAVARGEKFISPQLSAFLFNRSQRTVTLTKHNPGLQDLTPAERRVLRLIAENQTSRAIAEALFISVRTVDRHRENICNKLELHGSNALLKFAIAHKDQLL